MPTNEFELHIVIHSQQYWWTIGSLSSSIAMSPLSKLHKFFELRVKKKKLFNYHHNPVVRSVRRMLGDGNMKLSRSSCNSRQRTLLMTRDLPGNESSDSLWFVLQVRQFRPVPSSLLSFGNALLQSGEQKSLWFDQSSRVSTMGELRYWAIQFSTTNKVSFYSFFSEFVCIWLYRRSDKQRDAHLSMSRATG